MTRLLALASIGALCTAAAQAQCLAPASGTSVVGAGFVKWNSTDAYLSTYVFQDEGITNPPIALTAMPSFPMVGAIGNLDRLWVNSNGEVYLTDSTLALAAPANGILFGATDLAEMRGVAAGASARVVALGGDNSQSTAPGAVWDIAVDQTVAGQVRITWTDLARLGSGTTDRFSFDCTLFASGAVQYSYSASVPAAARCVGISIGNGVGSPASPSLDLTASADSGTEGLLHENFTAATWDLSGKQLMLLPNGGGGYTSVVLCSPAAHTTYGTGCYNFQAATESFLQLFTSSAAANATLQGNAMLMIPTPNGYSANWIAGGGALFVAPTGGATLLPVGDDTNQTVTPSLPFPSPNGPASQLNIQHNGFVTLAATPAQTGLAFNGTAALLASSTLAAFYNWFDFNDAEAGSGRIKTEEIGGIYYITWDGVEGYDAPVVANPHTWQFQFDLNTGNVLFVWTSINLNSLTGRNWLVGYSDAGLSSAATSIDLPTALPITTVPDINLQPLALSATPAPVYTPGNPAVPVTYTVNNIVDVAPPFGIGITLLIFSVAPIPGGVDMGFIGMPGCNLNIASLDVILTMPGSTAPADSIVLTIPQPLSPGLSFYSQALSLFTPNSLPNGGNAFGGVLSNGLQSTFNTF